MWNMIATSLMVGLLLAASSPASAQVVDEMDTAAGFVDASGPGKLEAADGAVSFTKTADGDAFVYYRHPTTRRWFELTPAHDVIEVDFRAFREGAGVQVRLALRDAQGKWSGAGTWSEHINQPGRQTLSSVRKLAADAGMPDATAYQLQFRVKGGPPCGFVIDRIRIADTPSSAPATAPAAP